MTSADSELNPTVSESKVREITALFKRIAERGHRIRMQNKGANTNNPVDSLPYSEPSSKSRSAASRNE